MKKGFFLMLATVLALLMLVACGGSNGGNRGGSSNNNNARNQGLNLPLVAENITVTRYGSDITVFITNDGVLHTTGGSFRDVSLNNVRSVYTHPQFGFGGVQVIYAIQNDNSLWAVGRGNLVSDGTGVNRNEFVKIAENVAFVITPGIVAGDVLHNSNPSVLGFITIDRNLYLLGVEPIRVAENVIRPLNGRHFLRSDGSVIELSTNNQVIETGITNVVDAYFAGTIPAGTNETNNPEGLHLSARRLWYTLSADGVVSYVEMREVHADGISTNEVFFSEIISDNVVAMQATGSIRVERMNLDSTVFVHLLKRDNTLWGFGANSQGQLGDGTRIDREELVKIADDVVDMIHGLRPLASGSAIRLHFYKTDGTLWSWSERSAADPTPIQLTTYPVSQMISLASSNNAIHLGGRLLMPDGTVKWLEHRNDVELRPETGAFENQYVMLPSTIIFD